MVIYEVWLETVRFIIVAYRGFKNILTYTLEIYLSAKGYWILATSWENEKSYPDIVNIIFILLYIASIFLVFHIIGLTVNKLWLDIILRGIFAWSLYYLANGGYKSAVKRLN